MKRRTVLLVPAIALAAGVIVMVSTMTSKTTDSLRGPTPADHEAVEAPHPHQDKTRTARADIAAIAAVVRQRQSEQDPGAAEASIEQAKRLIEATDATLSKLPSGPTGHGAPHESTASKPQQDLEARIAALREQLDGLQH